MVSSEDKAKFTPPTFLPALVIGLTAMGYPIKGQTEWLLSFNYQYTIIILMVVRSDVKHVLNVLFYPMGVCNSIMKPHTAADFPNMRGFMTWTLNV